MKDENYNVAGWAAFASALLFLPIMGLTLYSDFEQSSSLQIGSFKTMSLLLAICLDVASKGLLLYAFLRFRHLLNHRYGFHAVDKLILIVYVGGASIGVLSYLVRMLPEFKVPLIVTAVMLTVVCGILGILYATRLLRLNGNLNGLLKPLAYVSMMGSICFTLVVLAPVGLVLMVASTVILGLVLLRDGQDEFEELEVV
ncbi:MAG TPA: hypothetical protein VMY18_07510 [Acidobacteriota bacterium]|jgi:hypothetical protein|nr:hypothetical protein [Acidobacteriota bacterium]